MGLQSTRQPLPLAVGSAVHVGLAELLRHGQAHHDSLHMSNVEDDAVRAALADFSQHARSLALPDAEAAMLNTALIVTQGMGESNPMPDVKWARDEMDDYLFSEQSALVEALVRAYARRRLRHLLEQFEVLEVEREGEWELSAWSDGTDPYNGQNPRSIWFMSRPDALLRERESNQLYLLSYKTTGSWDIRKARDAEHDMQGMSEGIEIERRLAEWWDRIVHETPPWGRAQDPKLAGCSEAMFDYLRELDAPPRILGVRYEYMLKSERWKDKELSERFGVETRSQKSHLIRQYVAVSVPQRGAAGYNIGDVNWSWDYIRDDGRESSLAWQNFKSRAVWDQPGGVKAWIDKLDDAAPTMSGEDSTMGLEPRLLGYKCDAQAVGVTKEHPLDSVFVPPIIVYRQEDSLRDMVEQLEAVERRIAEGVAAVNAASDTGEVRHLLNIHFPQTLRACSFPTECSFTKICFAGETMRKDPVGSGLFKIRTPNHPIEGENK